MQINENILSQIKDAIILDPGEVLGVQQIEKIKNQKLCERILLITSNNFYIFSKKSLTRKYGISSQNRWDQLQEISANLIHYKNSPRTKMNIIYNTIVFIFNNETLTIKSDEADNILKTIVQNLSTIFPLYEMPQLKFNPKIYDGLKRKNDAILNRFKFMAYCSGKTITTAAYREFNNYCQKILKSPNIAQTLDLARFQNFYSLTDPILSSISLASNIKRVIVPLYKNGAASYWESMAKFVATNRTITTLEINDVYKPNNSTLLQSFNKFVNGIATNSHCKISRISFFNSIYDENFVVQLAVILEAHPFTNVCLFNGISENGFKVLVPMLNTVKGFQSVKNFALSGSQFINVESVITPLKNVQSFIFNNCNLDIANVLCLFAKVHNSAKKLSLSNNLCSDSISEELFFPPHLEKLNLDEVKWSGSSMVSLFQFLNRRESSNIVNSLLFIDISKATMSPSQWNQFDSFLKKFDCKFLRSLVFDQNPVGSGFLSFINRCGNLYELSLNGCFSNGDPMIDSFAEALSLNNSITNISLKGVGNDNILAESMHTILAAIHANANIKVLDISMNMAGDDICPELQNILMDNYNISDISFDGNNINNIESLRSLLTELIRVKRIIKIHPLVQDLSNNIKPSERNEINQLCDLLNQQAKSEETDSISDIKTIEKLSLGSFSNIDNEYICQINNERIKEEYISDMQWKSMLNDIPEVNLDDLTLQFVQQFAFDVLINEINAHDPDPV